MLRLYYCYCIYSNLGYDGDVDETEEEQIRKKNRRGGGR
jgi:hypothetical protein